MYTLFLNKASCRLEVSKAKKVFHNHEFTEEPVQYNDNYYFCKDEKPLQELADGMLESWVMEAEDRLHSLQDIQLQRAVQPNSIKIRKGKDINVSIGRKQVGSVQSISTNTVR